MAYVRTDLRLLKVQGPDARAFLNGLITQRTDLPVGSGTYAALLTPQGKLLADFPLLFVEDELLVLALPAGQFDEVMKRLSLFKLRSEIALSEWGEKQLISTITSFEEEARLPYADSRGTRLTHDIVDASASSQSLTPFHYQRALCQIPEGAYDLEFGKSTLIDEGLIRAINWDKGCYMGQEVTARMRYRALIKRVLVDFWGKATPGDEIRIEGKKVGIVRSFYPDEKAKGIVGLGRGFAYIRKEYMSTKTEIGLLGTPFRLIEMGLLDAPAPR